jgi:hypothetical protein
MGRFFRLTAVAGLALALSAGAVSAGIPDPALSTIPNVVASPGGAAAYQVSIQGAGGAFPHRTAAAFRGRPTGNSPRGESWSHDLLNRSNGDAIVSKRAAFPADPPP